MTGLTFDNFWKEKNWTLPYSSIIQDLFVFVENSRESRKNLIIDGVKEEWKVIKAAINKTTSLTSYMMGYSDKGKPPSNIARTFTIFLCLLKFLVVDEKNLTELRKYFQLNEWQTEQGNILSDDLPIFRSLPFIQAYVLHPTIVVTDHCIQRCIVEKKIIEVCRSTKGSKNLEADLNNCFPRFEKFVEELGLPEHKVVATDEKLNTSKTSKLTTKMRIAIHVTLLSDVIQTINCFGFNGKIELKDGCNRMVHFYVK